MTKSTASESSALSFLKRQFLEKRGKRPRYSIAAFARDLGVSAPFLSRVLSGQRPITVRLATQISTIFSMPQETTDRWLEEIALGSGKNKALSKKFSKKFKEALSLKVRSQDFSSIRSYELERFRAVSQWYHVAILCLCYTRDFKADSKWISSRLGIGALESRDAIRRLLFLGLIEKKGATYKTTQALLFVEAKKPDEGMRTFQRQMTEKAWEELSESSPQAFDARYMSGVTVAFDRKRVPEFQQKMIQFQKEILKMAENAPYTDVYQINLQLFPLTKQEKLK